MRQRTFMQVDVFTSQPFLGNPVAVVLDADDLDSERMQRIARWTNLSETTFVQSPTEPGADYRLRIFTPAAELPFAGHPTLGSAHALLAAGRVAPRDGRLVQQCTAGLVPIRLDVAAPGLWLRLPQARTTPVDVAIRAEVERIVGAPLSCEPQLIDVGPRCSVARHANAAALLALTPDLAALAALSLRLGATGLTLFAPGTDPSADPSANWATDPASYSATDPGSARDSASGRPRDARQTDGPAPWFEVRSWAPAHGVPEDPVCGSGNGCVAAYLAGDGLTRPYRARQGRAIGRDGHIRIRYDAAGIEVGGDAVVCVRGELLA